MNALDKLFGVKKMEVTDNESEFFLIEDQMTFVVKFKNKEAFQSLVDGANEASKNKAKWVTTFIVHNPNIKRK